MTTRLYLANSAAPYTPTTKRGAWDLNTATLARYLAPRPGGAATTAAVAESNATNNYDVLLGRWISDGAVAAATLSGTVEWIIGALESNAAANMQWHVHIFVTAGDSDTVRGTLLTDSIGATEWPTTATGRGEGTKSLSSVAMQVGDRICVEIGYQSQEASATTRTGTINYGIAAAASQTDLASASTAVTTNPGWLEFSGLDGILYPEIETIVDNFGDGGADNPPWNANYGGANATTGVGTVPCAHTGGTPDYAGIYSDGTLSQSLAWHIEDSSVFARLVQVPAAGGGSGSVYCQMAVMSGIDGQYAGILYDAVADQLIFQVTVDYFDAGAVAITYSSTTHKRGRIRYSAGILTFETSPDLYGSNWTSQRTVNPAPGWLRWGQLGWLMEAARDGGTNDNALFDDVNYTAVSGVLTANLGALTATAAGTPTVHGQATANLGALTGTAAGTPTVHGVATASLGALTATASGQVTVPGTAAGQLGALAGTATGQRTVYGTAAGSLGALTGTATGQRAVYGTAAASLGALAGTATGQRTVYGTAAGSLGALTGTAAGRPVISGTAAASLGALAGTATGQKTVHGAADGSLGALTAEGHGEESATVTGAASADLGALAATVAGRPVRHGTGVASLGALTASAAGQVTVPGQATASLGALTASAAGAKQVHGAASADLGALAGSSAGKRTVHAGAVASLGALVASAAGTPTVKGQAAGQLGALAAIVAGHRTVYADLSAVLAFTAHAVGAAGDIPGRSTSAVSSRRTSTPAVSSRRTSTAGVS